MRVNLHILNFAFIIYNICYRCSPLHSSHSLTHSIVFFRRFFSTNSDQHIYSTYSHCFLTFQTPCRACQCYCYTPNRCVPKSLYSYSVWKKKKKKFQLIAMYNCRIWWYKRQEEDEWEGWKGVWRRFCRTAFHFSAHLQRVRTGVHVHASYTHTVGVALCASICSPKYS